MTTQAEVGRPGLILQTGPSSGEVILEEGPTLPGPACGTASTFASWQSNCPEQLETAFSLHDNPATFCQVHTDGSDIVKQLALLLGLTLVGTAKDWEFWRLFADSVIVVATYRNAFGRRVKLCQKFVHCTCGQQRVTSNAKGITHRH